MQVRKSLKFKLLVCTHDALNKKSPAWGIFTNVLPICVPVDIFLHHASSTGTLHRGMQAMYPGQPVAVLLFDLRNHAERWQSGNAADC